jgi:hypothetical protein
MDRPFSRVGNSSFVLELWEVWEASDRISLPSSTEGSTMETRMENMRGSAPLAPYRSLDRQPRFDPKQKLC